MILREGSQNIKAKSNIKFKPEKIMKKVVVCDHIHNDGIEILKRANDINLVIAYDETKEKLLDIIADAQIVITRSSTPVNQKFLDHAKELEAIIRAGVGVDNVDIEGCSKRGIVVMNIPTANTIAAVELTMAHMLSSARSFPYAHTQLKNDRIWKRENWYGTELMGKKLGIIGFGNIGSRVGVRSKAFGMNVIAYDPYIHPSKVTDLGMTHTKELSDILSCDYITIHTPKNKETINYITKKEIAKMKDGVILINCARGGLYNEDDLYEGLKSGKVAFAGIDVFISEPATDNKLLDLENIVVTPHLGANTKESQVKIATQAASNALDVARGISYPNALNLPIKEGEVEEWAESYFELTQRLAFMAAQLNKGAIESIKVSATGEIKKYLDSLKTFAAVGALREAVAEQVNYVNALFLAQERGMEITGEEENIKTPYKNRVSVRITTEKDTIVVSGTVFEEDTHRIIDINGFDMDINPKGKMILFKNSDVPGVIGDVGSLLAKNNVNIADFRLGRDKNSQALAVIIVDEEISKEILEKLAALPAALSVSYVEI